MGRYQAAQSLYRQASEIELAAFGKEHPAYAMSLSGLAAVYEEQGDLAEAELLHRTACEIVRNKLGEQHPSYAASRGNIAKLYYRLGDYQAAQELLQQAVETNFAVFGEQHLDFAHSLNDLARLYDVSGKPDDAEPLYWRALNIWRKSGGAYHPGYANCLNDVGAMYSRRGDYESYRKAEFYYRLASDIRQVVYGKEHPMSAMSLNNLASVYDALGDYAAAEPVYREACDIARRIWGEDHALYARCLENLAGLCVARDRVAEAIPMLQQAMAIHDRTIGHVFAFTSENQRLIYLKTVQDSFYSFLSLALDHAAISPAIRDLAFDLVLRRKAVVAESLAMQREAVLAGEYGELKPKLEELSSVRMQIAQKTLAGLGTEEPSAYEQWLKRQNALRESLETELARRIPEMNLTKKLELADRWAVSLGLPEGAALVEFVRFDVFDFKAVPARGELRWGPAHYLAFVLPAGEPDNLQMIDLGEAEPIDRMIATFRSAITKEEESRGKRGLGALSSESIGEPNIGDGVALRAVLLDPLLPAIGNRKRLLLAPDSDLTRLPFEALPTDDGRRLIDDYQISYLGVGRDALRFGAASSEQPTAALVAADPDFDLRRRASSGTSNERNCR
jgi:tetratricopeptide (TPR) repeat protein